LWENVWQPEGVDGKHKQIVLCKMVSELSFAAQYILMGAYTGALVDLVSGLRNFLFYKRLKNKKNLVSK